MAALSRAPAGRTGRCGGGVSAAATITSTNASILATSARSPAANGSPNTIGLAAIVVRFAAALVRAITAPSPSCEGACPAQETRETRNHVPNFSKPARPLRGAAPKLWAGRRRSSGRGGAEALGGAAPKLWAGQRRSSGRGSTGALGGAAPELSYERDDQQCHDVGHLDHRVDRRSRRVLVGITHGIASHGRGMGL
jgi:hypothetical protein